MPSKPTSEAPTAPRREKIKTPIKHSLDDFTSGIDTAEGRQSSRNANIGTPQQKYRERRQRP